MRMLKNKNPLQPPPKGALHLMKHMTPHIRISPFIPQVWSELIRQERKDRLRLTENPRFWLDEACELRFFDSGRSALLACLKHLKLEENDEVLIITSTNGLYISSCVTHTIEKVCRWTRKISEYTRLVLVIHEFGIPCPPELFEPFKAQGIAILEDCAYCIGSRIENANVGKIGDFALYSLPKYYPIPYGGILVSKERISGNNPSLDLSQEDICLLKRTLINASYKHKEWNKLRRQNWTYFTNALTPHKISPYFNLKDSTIPGVFCVKLPQGFAGDICKINLVEAGVEATEYYHMGGFYFPVHQFLTDYEKQYILHHFLNPNASIN